MENQSARRKGSSLARRGRDPGPYKIGLKVTAEGYSDASAETTVTVLGYMPPIRDA